MKIILLKDVKKVGKKYEIKEVSAGHALNMLIPNGMAVPATLANVNMIEAKKKGDVLATTKTEAELEKILNDLKDVRIEIKGKVNDKGHLFAGIHKPEIIMALKTQKNISLPEEHLILEKPVKEVGDHKIIVKIGPKEGSLMLTIVAE